MFRHVVMFKWNDDIEAADVQAVTEGLNALPGSITEIAGYGHGQDVGLSDGNYDYVVVADFASQDDYITYRDHPIHQQFIHDCIVGRVAARAAVQIVCAD